MHLLKKALGIYILWHGCNIYYLGNQSEEGIQLPIQISDTFIMGMKENPLPSISFYYLENADLLCGERHGITRQTWQIIESFHTVSLMSAEEGEMGSRTK